MTAAERKFAQNKGYKGRCVGMNERLYNLMDWAEIEAVTYAETDNPHSLWEHRSRMRAS